MRSSTDGFMRRHAPKIIAVGFSLLAEPGCAPHTPPASLLSPGSGINLEEVCPQGLRPLTGPACGDVALGENYSSLDDLHFYDGTCGMWSVADQALEATGVTMAKHPKSMTRHSSGGGEMTVHTKSDGFNFDTDMPESHPYVVIDNGSLVIDPMAGRANLDFDLVGDASATSCMHIDADFNLNAEAGAVTATPGHVDPDGTCRPDDTALGTSLSRECPAVSAHTRDTLFALMSGVNESHDSTP